MTRDARMFATGNVQLGIEPTCWTNDDRPGLGDDIPFAQCVSEIALAGYAGCGLGHKAPADPDELVRELELRGLAVCDMWFGTYFTARDMGARTVERFRDTLALMTRIGASYIVVAELGHASHQQDVAVVPNTPAFDDAQWRALLKGLATLATLAADAGIRLGYHPHVGTGVMRRTEIDRLLAGTDPDRIDLVLDTGHLFYASEDPVAIVSDVATRIGHVHLKDVRSEVLEASLARGASFFEAILDGVFAVPGDGCIPFEPILRKLAGHEFQGWLVVEAEQDPGKAEPLVQAMKARRYLAEVAGL